MLNFSELFYYTIIYNKMSYTNGNEYIIKSMNGIKTYDDGSGTVIENGEISTSIMTTDDMNCLFTLRAPSIITDSLGSSTSLTISSIASTLYDFSVLTKTATENSTKAASTAFVNTAITNLKSATNTWSGPTNTFSNSIIVPTQTANNNSTNAST
jgi:hypothetical protein